MPAQIDVTSAKSWPQLQDTLTRGLEAEKSNDREAHDAALAEAKVLTGRVTAELTQNLIGRQGAIQGLEDKLAVLQNEASRLGSSAKARVDMPNSSRLEADAAQLDLEEALAASKARLEALDRGERVKARHQGQLAAPALPGRIQALLEAVEATAAQVSRLEAELTSPITTEYDEWGNPVALSRASGRVLVLQYDQAGRIVGAVPQ